MNTLRKALWTSAALVAFALVFTPAPAAADICHLDDVIIDGSLCVGFDCVCNMSFGFDTIVLQENNLRIFFNDTSTASSFPQNDWRIRINDSANGGSSYFAVEDATAGRTPFRVDAGARSNALYVDSQGDVGVGTSTPATDIHIRIGDTPTLRLEQDGSSGFTPQIWDLAGNETNFFVRDVTHGSALPFRIRPDAPTNSIFVDTDGDVGLNTASVAGSASLHVVANTGAADDLVLMTNNGPTRFALQNTAGGGASDTWRFNHAAGGILRIASGGAATEVELDQSGNMTIAGGLVTGTVGSCTVGTPCDRLFHPDFEVESIEEHAEYMWTNSHLKGVGPTVAGQPINITRKTTGILNELEKAHVYIEQLNNSLVAKDGELDELRQRLAALEEAVLANGATVQ